MQCKKSFMCIQVVILKTQSQEKNMRSKWEICFCDHGKVILYFKGKERSCARTCKLAYVVKCQNSSYLWLAEAFEVFSIWYRKTYEQVRFSYYMD
jgi:hypothetical protein